MNKKILYINGDLKITEDNQLEFKDYIAITAKGNVYIYASANNLRTITAKGYVYIYASANNLRTITAKGNVYINASAKVDNLRTITAKGSVDINASAKVDNLRTITAKGYVDINASANNLVDVKATGAIKLNSQFPDKFEHRLWKNNRNNKWYLTDKCSEFLLSCKGKIEYKINNVIFEKELFDKVRKDQLTAQEVFAIQNMEQRRVAYEKMDKIKMRELPNLRVLEERKDDGYGYPDKVISFTIDGFNEDFRFYNCFDPSTGREYFLETRQITCAKAKAKSFGLNSIVFDEEW